MSSSKSKSESEHRLSKAQALWLIVANGSLIFIYFAFVIAVAGAFIWAFINFEQT